MVSPCVTGGLFRRPEVYKPIGLVSPRGRPSTNCTDSTLLTRERGDARGDGILGLVCETVAYATDFEDRRVRPMESCGALTATVNGPSRLNGEYTFRTALLVCAGDTGASTVVVALLRVPGKNMEANTMSLLSPLPLPEMEDRRRPIEVLADEKLPAERERSRELQYEGLGLSKPGMRNNPAFGSVQARCFFTTRSLSDEYLSRVISPGKARASPCELRRREGKESNSHG